MPFRAVRHSQSAASNYHGFANGVDVAAACNRRDRGSRASRRVWWQSYQSVNDISRTRAVTARCDKPGTRLAWVHEYQLMLVPRAESGTVPGSSRIGFVLHVALAAAGTSSPPGWPHGRQEILSGSSGATFVSSIEGYRRNFVRTLRRLLADNGVQITKSSNYHPGPTAGWCVTNEWPHIDRTRRSSGARSPTDPGGPAATSSASGAVRGQGTCLLGAGTVSTTTRASSKRLLAVRCSFEPARRPAAKRVLAP